MQEHEAMRFCGEVLQEENPQNQQVAQDSS